MFSVIVCSRKKDNPDSKLPEFFDSLIKNSHDLGSFEVLLRFDKDDTESLSILPTIYNYPFKTEYIVDERGKGSMDFHIFQWQMLHVARADSKFFVTMCDDYLVKPGWDKTLMDCYNNRKSDFFVMQHANNHDMSKFDVNDDKFLFGLEVAPVFSKRLLYTCGNLGDMAMTDGWAMCLQAKLLKQYAVNISLFTSEQYVERCSSYKTDFKSQIHREGQRIWYFKYVKTRHFLDLIDAQAKSIYLTMKDEKLI